MKKKKIGLIKRLFVLICVGITFLLFLAFYPLWFLFVKIVNFIGKKNIRSANGKIQTPVVFYEHPITKRIVVFVAMIHIGESEYYTTIQELINSLKGYKILFEGTNSLSREEELALTPKEKEVADQFNAVFGLMKEFCELMSLQHQKEGLTYSTSWVNTDMKLYDLIQTFTQQDICLMKNSENIDGLFTAEKEFEQFITRWVINKILKNFVAIGVIFAINTLFSKNKRAVKRLILDARNEIAFKAIVEHLKDGDVVTIWGAAHLPGIEKYLKKFGFKEVQRKWFTAYKVRNYSFLDAVKKEAENAKKMAIITATLKKD